jgi:hypothetical protein
LQVINLMMTSQLIFIHPKLKYVIDTSAQSYILLALKINEK